MNHHTMPKYHIALIVLLFTTVTTPNVQAVQSSQTENELVFHISDFGINQLWTEKMKVGNPFLGEHNRVFPELNATGRQGSQILIPMPSDEDMRNMSDTDLSDRIAKDLIEAVNRAHDNGIVAFEIQLVQNINKKGYFAPWRQKSVKKFGAAAYSAIGRMVDSQKGKGNSITIDATLGSNGTVAFTENISSWKHYKEFIRKIDLIDGRASLGATIKTIRAIGQSKVRVFNTLRDLPAPPITSIGNFETTKKLLKAFPRLTAFLLRPDNMSGKLTSHISRMADLNSSYNVERWFNDSKGAIKHVTLQKTFTARDFRHPVNGLSTTVQSLHNPAASKISAQDLMFNNKIKIHRSKIESLVNSLTTMSEAINKFSPILIKNKSIMQKIVTPDDVLKKALNNVQSIYDFQIALEKDLDRNSKGNYTFLSSHTLEQASRFGLSVLIDTVENFQKTKILNKNIPVSTYGLDDLVIASAKHIGSGHANVETITSYVDGLNKAVWGVLGLVVSKGDPKVAKAFQEIGNTSAKLGRLLTASSFIKAYDKFMGVDKALVQTYLDAQQNKINILGGRAKRETIQEFFGFDKNILNKISPVQAKQANSRFGLSSQRKINSQKITTRTTTTSYQETCKAGNCTRTNLAPPSPSEVGSNLSKKEITNLSPSVVRVEKLRHTEITRRRSDVYDDLEKDLYWRFDPPDPPSGSSRKISKWLSSGDDMPKGIAKIDNPTPQHLNLPAAPPDIVIENGWNIQPRFNSLRNKNFDFDIGFNKLNNSMLNQHRMNNTLSRNLFSKFSLNSSDLTTHFKKKPLLQFRQNDVYQDFIKNIPVNNRLQSQPIPPSISNFGRMNSFTNSINKPGGVFMDDYMPDLDEFFDENKRNYE